MNIPSAVKIGGRTYTVELTNRPCVNDANIAGEIIYDAGTIKIANNARADDYREQVFLHECIHGLLYFLCLDQDEEFIDRFSKGLQAFIKDNPEVFQ